MLANSSLSPTDAALVALRPTLAQEQSTEPINTVGYFLHLTLRPVLKLQNLRLLTAVADFLADHHVPYQIASTTERERLVAEILSQNTKLRYTVIGLVTALFTDDETTFYRAHRAEVNRRLLELAVRRVQDQTATVASLALPG